MRHQLKNQMPHREHLLEQDPQGNIRICRLDHRAVRRRLQQPVVTFVEKDPAQRDMERINRRSSKVTTIHSNKENYFCIQSPTHDEIRVYKEHNVGHPSDKLIPVGSCKISDPSQEGSSMHTTRGSSYLEIAALLHHSKSPTRVTIRKELLSSTSPLARGILTEKNWRTQHSPNTTAIPCSPIPSPSIVRTCAKHLLFHHQAPTLIVPGVAQTQQLRS